MSFLNIISNLSKGTGTTGGGAPPVDPINPADIDAVINWYDVTDNAAIVTSSGRVTQLTDKKSTRDLTQNSSSLYPSYSATGGSNNQAYITIDPTQWIQDNLGSWTGTGGAMGFMVLRLNTVTPTLNGLGDYQNVICGWGNRGFGLLMNNLTYGYAPYLYAYTGDVNSTVFTYMANTDWQIICFKCFNGLTEFYPNNQPCGITCKNTLAYQQPNNINLGWFSLNADYRMSELIFADETLSSDDEKGIVAYLMDKYQIIPKPFIQCYGDSLTAGTCDPPNNWPFIVAADNDLQLVNFGVGGTIVQPNSGSTGVANKNFVDLLPTALKWPYSNQWVVVGYGVNDTSQGGINATWKALYKARLQEMLTWGYNPNKFILTIPPSKSDRQSLMAQTNTYISEIASELGLILFDCNALFLANGGDSLFADSLHPGAAGNVLTANAITDIINS